MTDDEKIKNYFKECGYDDAEQSNEKPDNIMTGDEFTKEIDKEGFYFVKHVLYNDVMPAMYVGLGYWSIIGSSIKAPSSVIKRVYTIPINKPENFK